MAAGLPSVAADVPDNRWLLGDREAGLLFPADDAAELAAAILYLLDDAETANWMEPPPGSGHNAISRSRAWRMGFSSCWKRRVNTPFRLFASSRPCLQLL